MNRRFSSDDWRRWLLGLFHCLPPGLDDQPDAKEVNHDLNDRNAATRQSYNDIECERQADDDHGDENGWPASKREDESPAQHHDDCWRDQNQEPFW